MSSIDERVVQMKFDNTQFQSGVKSTATALDNLKKNLNLEGAAKGLQNLNAASKGFSLAGMASGIDSLVSKFSNLSIVGITALTNIANKAVNAGLQMAKSLTIDPVKQGFDEYELKMGSIQTILSNTARYGTKLPEVTRNLDALNKYADKTIYNFGDMTKNIGLFTNSGMRVGEATSMIKGFSNEAAASGTSAEGAAGAAYQLSQAMSAGKVTLMDWRSLQNVGMGNANMKKGIIDIAQAMGTMKDKGVSAKDAQKDFNGTLEKGWLTAGVMTKYMKIMSGEMTDAQMKQMGLSKTQIKAFKIQQKNAEEAATKVRTFSQLIGTLRESVGSGWSETFDLLVGNFTQATTLFTNVNNSLGGIINGFATRRNAMLKDFVKFGGRDALIDGLANSFKALMSILRPVIAAFRDFFPAKTGKEMATMAQNFKRFTETLIPGKKTMEQIRTIFRAVFGVLSIGVSVVKGIISYFLTFFGVVAGGTGGVMDFVSGIAQVIYKFTQWIQQGDKIGAFFDHLAQARTAVLVPIVAMVSKIISAFSLLFKGDFAGFGNALKASFGGFEPIVAAIQTKINNLFELFNKGVNIVKKFFGAPAEGSTATSFVSIIESIQSKVRGLQETLNKGVSAVRDLFNGLNSSINATGLEGAAKASSAFSTAGEKARSVWESVSNGFSNVSAMLAPISNKLGAFFGTLADKLTEYVKGLDMQDAVALLNTGFFIAMYAMMRKFVKQVNDLVGQFGDAIESLKTIFDGVGDMFGQLTDTLKAMQQSIQATTILKIAIAVGVLAASMWVLSKINPEDLKKALIAITVLFGQLMITMYAFSKMSFGPEMAKAGTALLLLAIAVNILATAVQKMAGLDWEQLAKGLVGVGGILVGLALFTKFANANSGGIKAGAGLILLGIAVNILATAVQKLGSMDTAALVQGVIALNVMIVALMGAVHIMNGTKGIPQAAIGLLLLSVALAALTVTMRIYAALDWLTLIKGLGTMAATLGLIGAAMRTMPKDMPSKAAGLLIVSAALIILAGALKMMGGMSIEDLAKALVTLTVALGVIAIALIAMEASIPGAQALIIAAAAITVLAIAMQIIGSMDIQSVGTALLAIAGVLAILGVAAALMIPLGPGLLVLAGAVQAMGLAMLLAGAGFALFAGGFAVMAAVGTAGVAVLVAAFTGILGLIPLFMQQIALGLRAFAKVIADSGPVIIAALTTLLLSLLTAIDNVIPKAIDTMVKFITALLLAIQRIAPQFYRTIEVLVMGMVNTVARLVPRIVDAGLRMINGFLKAVGDHVPEIVKHGTDIITKFLGAIAKAVPEIVDAGYKMVIDILNGVTDSVNNNSAALGRAGGDLASAIIRGMVNGIASGISSVLTEVRNLAGQALDAARSFLGIHSPSREFYKIGQFVVYGFRDGIDGNKEQVQKSFTSLKTMLTDMRVHAKAEVDKQEKALYKLTHAHKQNKKAIADTRAALAQARREYTLSTNALTNLTKNWTDDKNRLGQLATQYDALGVKLKAANQKLADAKKTRDDYNNSVKDQYNDIPAITGETKLQDFANDIRKKIEDNKAMLNKMTALRKLGLNDTMYKELMAKGTDALPFIDELLGTGKSGVSQINTLSSGLDKSAADLGASASKALYQAGVDSAAGIVKGLQTQQKAIEKQMDVIANAMVKSIKKSLGIKSPSREFMKVGKFSMMGVSKGFEQHSKMVERSASSVGSDAIQAMRKSITGLDKVVADNIRTDPVISPVLDLSAVRKDASRMGSIFAGHGISLSSGYTGAKNAAEGYKANVDARSIDHPVVENKQEINMTQINNSPKAISAADTYRSQKSLIATTKGALGKR